MSTTLPHHHRLHALIAALVLLVALSPMSASAELPEQQPDRDAYTIVSQEVTPAAVRTVVRVNVSQDAFLSSRNADSNYGGQINMRMGWESGAFDAMRLMIQFDLGGIPRNATVNNARLYVYQSQSIPGFDGPMAFRAQFVNSSWNEYGVTWNNANYLGGDALPLEDVDSSIGWKSTDVTGLIHTWHNGSRPNHGLILTGDETPSNNRSRSFNTRESGSGAYIEVDYSVQCDTIPPQTTMAGLPQYSPGLFLVGWSGQDFAPAGCTPSGISYYDVYYRINGGSWVHWKNQTTSTSQHFKNYASNGDRVDLSARAADRAGNLEEQHGSQVTTFIDTQPPTTAMTPLPQFTTTPYFTVNWSGSDNLSGVKSYDLQWRINEGNWQILVENTPATSYQITGAQANAQYDFRVRATDNVDNVQDFSELAQASTVIREYPVAHIQPIQPPIIKPTAPVTDRIALTWAVNVAPGTELTSVEIYYQYNGGTWTSWKTFAGSRFNADFDYPSLGLGDGSYGFQAIGTNNLGQTQPLETIPQQAAVVDLADAINPVAFLPVVYE